MIDKIVLTHGVKRPACKIGDLVIVPIDVPNVSIFNMVTMTKFCDKPSYKSLVMCLETLKRELVLLQLDCVSMPMIGCGLDCLDWHSVLAILHSVFAGTSIRISVYLLEQPCPRYCILTLSTPQLAFCSPENFQVSDILCKMVSDCMIEEPKYVHNVSIAHDDEQIEAHKIWLRIS